MKHMTARKLCVSSKLNLYRCSNLSVYQSTLNRRSEKRANNRRILWKEGRFNFDQEPSNVKLMFITACCNSAPIFGE